MSKRFDALMARERAVQRIIDQVNAQADATPNAAPETATALKPDIAQRDLAAKIAHTLRGSSMLPPGTRVEDWFTPEHRSKTLIEF